MKDLESRLERLPLREPSPGLDERVMAQKPARPPAAVKGPQRVPVWLTAAIAGAMAVMGFAAGVSWRGQAPAEVAEPRLAPPVIIHVIYNSPSSGNPFDFTLASDSFPAGKIEAQIKGGEAIDGASRRPETREDPARGDGIASLPSVPWVPPVDRNDTGEIIVRGVQS